MAVRYVCQFSCGAASAVATKLTLAKAGDADVLIVNAFIIEEHEDNRRFLADCEQWFGQSVMVLRNDKYNASTDEVWRRKRFIKGLHSAPCSLELKRELLKTVRRLGDIDVMGFTADPEDVDRFENLCERMPERSLCAPLIERGLTKEDCLAIVHRAGIEIPAMYKLGYSNANCIGCPKGGQAYWQAIREDFPERFAAVKAIQEEIGDGASFLRFRSGPRKDERMSLEELPPGRGNMKHDGNFSCSFFCEDAMAVIR